MLIAEHSMCQPGRPSPHGLGQDTSPSSDARAFHNAKSATASLAYSSLLTRSPARISRGGGVFVPFLGRPASTFLGPARMVLHTGATLLMGVPIREADGRLVFGSDARADGVAEET